MYEGRSTLDSEKESYLLATITPLKVFGYNFEVAKLAGQIARDLTNPIALADAAIAATAIYHKTQLATLNKKHFETIDELSLYPYS